MARLTERLFDLTGEVALVTGASSGLGARFARVLAGQGASVALTARRTDRLEALAAEIAAAGGTAFPVALDVTRRNDIGAAFDAAERQLGPVTILVNNAGVALERKVLEQDAGDWRKVLDTNLDAVWFVAQEAARRMAERGQGGAIVNIASILGLAVARQLSAYAVAKAGVVQVTKAMALELASRGIRVNAIAPGYILTDINRHFFETGVGAEYVQRKIPMKRIGAAEDLDGALLLLASRASAFMTGSVIVVDGGQLLAGG